MCRAISRFFLILLLGLIFLPLPAAAAEKGRVYVLRIDEMREIGPTLVRMTEQVFQQAAADPNAVAVELVINTPGGLVTSALEMKDIILRSRLRTIAFVDSNALSAGALIATAAEKLFMAPGAVIGAAEPRMAGSVDPADAKTLSAVVGAFTATAQARGRSTEIAQAMVDRKAPIPGQKSELLTLTYQEAIERRYADGQAKSLNEAVEKAGIVDFVLVDHSLEFSDRFGRFLTTPLVAVLLLVVGVIAIGIEFMKPGVTVPGVIGVVSLSLFFLGNVLVGTAGWLELMLALIGIVLLVIEAFIPGFGIFGVSGIISVAASIFLAVPTTELGIQYLMWTALAFVVALFAIVRGISRRGLGKLLTLRQDATGWVAPRTDLTTLLGREGQALTVLRPAGIARFDTTKLDVVTEGEFVTAGTPVVVIRVEGTRVVVRSMTM